MTSYNISSCINLLTITSMITCNFYCLPSFLNFWNFHWLFKWDCIQNRYSTPTSLWNFVSFCKAKSFMCITHFPSLNMLVIYIPYTYKLSLVSIWIWFNIHMQLNHTLGFKLETDIKKESHMYHVQIINLILMSQPTVSLSCFLSRHPQLTSTVYTRVSHAFRRPEWGYMLVFVSSNTL